VVKKKVDLKGNLFMTKRLLSSGSLIFALYMAFAPAPHAAEPQQKNIMSTCKTKYWYDAYNQLAEHVRLYQVCAGSYNWVPVQCSSFFSMQDIVIKNFPDDISFGYGSIWTYDPFKKGKNKNIYHKKTGYNKDWNDNDPIWQDQPGGKTGIYDKGIDVPIFPGDDSLQDGNKGFSDGSIYYFDNNSNNVCDPDEEVWMDSVQSTNLNILISNLQVFIMTKLLQTQYVNLAVNQGNFTNLKDIPHLLDYNYETDKYSPESIKLFPEHSGNAAYQFTIVPTHLQDGTEITDTPIYGYSLMSEFSSWYYTNMLPALPVHFDEIRRILNMNIFKGALFPVKWDNKGEMNYIDYDSNSGYALSAIPTRQPAASCFYNSNSNYKTATRSYSYLSLAHSFHKDYICPSFEADFYVKGGKNEKFFSYGDPIIENKWSLFSQQYGSSSINTLAAKFGSLNIPENINGGYSASGAIIIKWNFPTVNIPPFEPQLNPTPDTNRDDIVDIGIDMNNIFNETGTIVHQPDMNVPQVFIPLHKNGLPGDNLFTYDYISQGGILSNKFSLRDYWDHQYYYHYANYLSVISPNIRDSSNILSHRSLNNNLFIDICITNREKNIFVKRMGIIRPRGQVVIFNFPWNPEKNKFEDIGLPVGIHSQRTYRLVRDEDNPNSFIKSYSLLFENDINHVFAVYQTGSLKPEIRHNTRFIGIRRRNNIKPDGYYWGDFFLKNTGKGEMHAPIRGLKYDISYEWNDDALLAKLTYTPKDGNTANNIIVELEYDPNDIGRIIKLKKTVPQSLVINGQTQYEIAINGNNITYPDGSTSTREQTAPIGNARVVTITKTDTNYKITVSKYYYNASDLITKLEITANGDTETTDYAYNDVGTVYPNTTKSEHKLKSITYSDGSWKCFTYNVNGRLEKEYSPFKNLPAIPSTGGKETEYGYIPHEDDDVVDNNMICDTPRTTIKKVNGKETVRSYFSYVINDSFFADDGDADNISINKICVSLGTSWNDSTNLSTKTTNYYGYSPRKIESYLTVVTPPVTGSIYQEEGELLNPSNIYNYRNKRKMTYTVTSADGADLHEVTTITNPRGIEESRIVKDTVSGEIIESAISQVDSFYRITRTNYLDGTFEKLNNYCLYGPQTVIDRLGNTTEYLYYANGDIQFVITALTVTEYTYDALGNISSQETTPVSGVGEVITESWTYDALSRIKTDTKAVGTTHYVYNGVDVTVTYPDGTTKIIDNNLDGTVASISGTAVSHVTYDYGVDATKGYWTKSTTPDGVWNQTFYNMLGKPYLAEHSSGYWSKTLFDSKGRIASTIDSSDKTSSTVYNDKNEISQTTANKIVSDYKYTITGGNHVRTATIQSSLGDIVSVSKTSLDGKTSTSTINERTTKTEIDYQGNGTVKTTTTDPFGRITENISGNLSNESKVSLNGVKIAGTTSTMDAHGRIIESDDFRRGISSFEYRPQTSQVAKVTSPTNETTIIGYQPGKYEPSAITTPYNSTINPLFNERGEFKGFNGTAHSVFDAITSYDDLGRQDKITTNGAAGLGETKFNYSQNDGMLTSKTIAGVSVFSQEFHPDGRPKTKTVAGVTKTFKYTAAPQLFPAGVEYSGPVNTPNIEVTGHNTFGQPGKIITSGTCTHDYLYNLDGQITDDKVSSALIDDRSNFYGYQNLQRELFISGSNTVSYTYDDTKRLKTVTADDIETTYSYIEKSLNLIDTITIKKNDTIIIVRDFDYEQNSNKISLVTNKNANGTVLKSFAYKYKPNENKIDSITLQDGTELKYEYDERGQLTSEIRRQDTLQLTEYGYSCDSIANILSGGRLLFGSLPEFTFTPSIFNDIQLSISGNTVELSGTADKDAAITINNERVERQPGSEYFSSSIPADNTDSATYVSVKISGVLFDLTAMPEIGGDQSGNTPGADLIKEIDGFVFMPKNNELPVYTDGKLTSDSGKTCTWDIEGRLLTIESTIKNPTGKYTKITNEYDHAGRRIKKSIYYKQTTSDSWLQKPNIEHHFYYDTVLLNGSTADFGLLTGEKITNNVSNESTELQYVWGLDNNGSYQGMGGIGGLLAVIDKTNTKTYLPVMDMKGTIHSYIDAATGNTIAEFKYTPYGGILKAEGEFANMLTLRYNNKYYDKEFALYYHDTRYYNPRTCKWLSRDTIGESGGVNLYAYCNNDPINGIDYLGTKAYGYDFTGPLNWMDWHESKYTQAEVEKVYAIMKKRDRHIYNTGLANTSSDRASSKLLLEQTLGVPVQVPWNPTFTELGVGIQDAGEYIGRHGWTWNPIKMTGNVLGGITEGTGFILNVTGVAADVVVAGIEKIPLARKVEPTYIHSMSIYNKSLQHVMKQKDQNAKVYGWMHSEGAIHGSNIMDSLSKDELGSVKARTFGAGGYMFRKMDITHYGNEGTWWLISRDFVPGFAGIDYMRNKKEINWKKVPEGYVHGFPTYVKYHIIGISKKYFKENAIRVIGR
jgi:RHS repeat-associated protein